MKILFLANRFPYPPFRGDKLKIYNLAKRLARNHDVDLVTFVQQKSDLGYLSELEEIFHDIHLVYLPKWRSYVNCCLGLFSSIPFQVLYFRSDEMNKLLASVSKVNYDVVHVQHMRMAQFKRHLSSPALLDLPDAFSLYWSRRLKTKRVWWQKLFDRVESKRVGKYEKVIKEFPLCLVCSNEDKTHLEELHGVNHVRLLPNGVDMTTFGTEEADYRIANTLLFTGNMNYAPNVDGVLYFVNEILPLVKKEIPNVEFVIAGQKPVNAVLELEKLKGIRVTGFVESIAKLYYEASVVVAPLRFGAGTQNKVLESMACGIPVVCTEIGFKGLGIESGEGAIKTDSSEVFASEVIKLLKSEQLRREVGTKGKQIIQNHFDWNTLSKVLENHLIKVSD